MDNIEIKVDEIRAALLGNEYNKQGLLQRLEAIEDYQRSDKRFKWMVAGGVSVISFLIGFFKWKIY